MPALSASAASHAVRQHGVLTRAQLGLTKRGLTTALHQGWLKSTRRGPVLLAGGSGFERRAWSALLGASPDAHVAELAAAHLMGLDGFGEPKLVEVLVPYGKGAKRRPGVILRRSRSIGPLDRATVHGIRITSGARTIIDLAGRRDVSDAQLVDAIDSAIRDGWTSEEFLIRQMDRLCGPGRRGAARLRRLVHGTCRVHSHLERTFLDGLAGSGLPMPTTQHVVLTKDGKVRRVDCWFAEHNLVAEVSGHRNHSLRSARRGDAQRWRAIVATGKRVVEFTSDEIFDGWPGVERDMRNLLHGG
jgi:hypothetical protein